MQIHDFLKQSPLVKQALTTKGYAYENHLDYDNQRLEFLGDAVMDMIVSQELYSRHDLPEGELTRLRSSGVNEASFAKLARAFELDQRLLVAKGQDLIDSLLADAFEALIGAYFITFDYEVTKQTILQEVWPLIDFSDKRDPKSTLQEHLQARGISAIEYRTLDQQGPDHARQFVVGLYLSGKEVARGQGRSKKEAQKAAAADYLTRL